MRCSVSHLSFELYSRVARISLAAALFLPAFLPAAFSQVAPAQVPPTQAAPAQAASAPQTASQVSLTTLEQGKAIEREISGKNADSFDLPLQAGQFAEISVEQRGIDVVMIARPSTEGTSVGTTDEAMAWCQDVVGLTGA